MHIRLTGTPPSPAPSCGYRVQYRRKSASTYLELPSSGSVYTSGTTSFDITLNDYDFDAIVPYQSCVEGRVLTDCCSSNLGTGTPFGVNAYTPMEVSGTVTNIGPDGYLNITVTSTFANPYDYVVDVYYSINATPEQLVSFTYFAGERNHALSTIDLGGSGATLTGLRLGDITPLYTYGGQLQQLDLVTTPFASQFYWAENTSGTTWYGAPTSLPSFTLDQFVPTATDSGGVSRGDLYISYIINSIYPNSFTSNLFEVYDSAEELLGSLIVAKTPKGARSIVITLDRHIDQLTSAALFSIVVKWPNGVIIDKKYFHLP